MRGNISFLPVNTAHLYIWINDGKNFADHELPLPQNEKFDYYKTLKIECEKLARTKTPAYLFYKGDLLKEGQREKMEELSKEIPNLFVIDYDRCYESIDDQGKNIYVDFETCCLSGSIDKVDLAFIQKMQESIKSFKENNGKVKLGLPGDSLGSLAHLVDLMKMFSIYRCDMMHVIALQKYKDDPSKKDFSSAIKESSGILYRDFDVTLSGPIMQRLELFQGRYAFATNRSILQTERVSEILKSIKDPSLEPAIAEYCKRIFSDPKSFLEAFDAFLVTPESQDGYLKGKIRELETEFLKVTNYHFNEALKEEGTREYYLSEIIQNPHKSQFFQHILFEKSNKLAIENSLIAFPSPKFLDFRSIILEDISGSTPESKTPYSLFKGILIDDLIGPNIEKNVPYISSLAFALYKIESVFNIGHDSSWTSVQKKDIAGAIPSPRPEVLETLPRKPNKEASLS